MPTGLDAVDIGGAPVLVAAEGAHAYALPGKEDVTPEAFLDVLACGVEVGFVQYKRRIGLAIDVDALPVVHVDAEAAILALPHGPVPIDGIVGGKRVVAACELDMVDARVAVFAVPQFKEGIGAWRIVPLGLGGGQGDHEVGLAFGRQVGGEGQFVGHEVAIHIVQLRGVFVSVGIGDDGRGYIDACRQVLVQVHHHGSILPRKVGTIGDGDGECLGTGCCDGRKQAQCHEGESVCMHDG